MKVKIVAVGEGGTFLVPLPNSILDYLGWKDGDDLTLDVGMTGNTVIMFKNDEPARKIVPIVGVNKGREVV